MTCRVCCGQGGFASGFGAADPYEQAWDRCDACDGEGEVANDADEPPACVKCAGEGCAHCGQTGSEVTRRELQDCGEHPVVGSTVLPAEAV